MVIWSIISGLIKNHIGCIPKRSSLLFKILFISHHLIERVVNSKFTMIQRLLDFRRTWTIPLAGCMWTLPAWFHFLRFWRENLTWGVQWISSGLLLWACIFSTSLIVDMVLSLELKKFIHLATYLALVGHSLVTLVVVGARLKYWGWKLACRPKGIKSGRTLFDHHVKLRVILQQVKVRRSIRDIVYWLALFTEYHRCLMHVLPCVFFSLVPQGHHSRLDLTFFQWILIAEVTSAELFTSIDRYALTSIRLVEYGVLLITGTLALCKRHGF